LVAPFQVEGKYAMPPLFPRLILAALCAVSFGLNSFASAADEKESKSDSADSQFDVPAGTPQELLEFVQKQQDEAKRLSSQSGGLSRKARMSRIQDVFKAIVIATERISDMKVDDSTLAAALKSEVEALTMLKRISDDDTEKKEASDKLEALTEKLKNDKRPAIANLLKVQELTQRMEKFGDQQRGNGHQLTDPNEVETFVTDVKVYANSAEPDAQMAGLAQAGAILLYNTGKQKEAAEFGRDMVEKLSKSEKQEVIVAAAQMLKQAVGPLLEMQGQEKQAAKLYRALAEQLSKSDNPTMNQFAEQFEGSARKLELVGQSMAITGKLVEGGKFDISQFKGKVVLVDFWATWCGPCIAELPNVKDVYARYHDQGFEVVGISLDNDKDDLTKFISEEHLPWPILFEGGEESSGWGHPLAKKYGVNAIPMAVLVNREGKVVTLNARGERLGEMVDQLLSAKPGSGAGTASDKKKAG
jgi:peroxiredoxin